VGVLCTWAVMLAIYFHRVQPRALITVVLLISFVSIALTLARLGDMNTAALRLAASTFGPLWIGGGVGALATLRLLGEPHGAGYVILALCFAWMSDTGGYFAGRFLGKRRLYEAVSPKKTIAGSVGGVVAATLAALAFRHFLIPTMPILHTVVLGLLASFLGQLGDLGESLLKRSVGVKDSGGIVPGHGGMLDRIDAAVITSSLTLVYLEWWQ
jgi:phosphatidate cytidylyltransferase